MHPFLKLPTQLLPWLLKDNSKVSFVNNLKKCANDTKIKIPVLDFLPTKEEPMRYVKLSFFLNLNKINQVDYRFTGMLVQDCPLHITPYWCMLMSILKYYTMKSKIY